jgi:hypothetical protein
MPSLFDCILLKPLDKMCCDHRQHFDFFQDGNIHDKKCHPCPSMICVIIDNILDFLPTQTWSCFAYTLFSLLFLKLFLVYSCDLQTQPLLETPYYCYPEAWLWYSEYQQEHRKRNAKCFLINYPNTIVWVTSWISSPLYLNDFVLAVLSCISCSAFPWEGYTPNTCV